MCDKKKERFCFICNTPEFSLRENGNGLTRKDVKELTSVCSKGCRLVFLKLMVLAGATDAMFPM